ncbi:MAG TPA: hypothetical protein V6C88_09495 [Chroococcidiopsis sp.]
MSYQEWAPRIKGDLDEHFPGAVSWGITSPANSRVSYWQCDLCECRDRLLVYGAARVMFHGCIACWLGCDRQLSLLGGEL